MKKQFFLSIIALTSFAPTLVHAHPLYKAAGQGDLSSVQDLLRPGSIDSYTNRHALFLAASWGHEHIVKELLQAEAQHNGWDQHHGTLLHFAAAGNHVAAATLLLRSGEFEIDTQDGNYATPLHIAAAHGQTDVAHMLIRAGADFGALDAHERPPLHYALPALEGLNKKGALKTIQTLLNRGASLHTKKLTQAEMNSLRPYVPLAENWAWHAQAAVHALGEDLPQDLLRLIGEFTSNDATPVKQCGLIRRALNRVNQEIKNRLNMALISKEA